MQTQGPLSLIASEEYYLPLWLYENTQEFIDIIKNKERITGWQIGKDRIFISCSPQNYKYLEHGWKIHISSSKKNNEIILDIVSTYCFENQVAFKFLMDKKIFDLLQNKTAPRGSSGKFITIYPSSVKDFKHHIEHLYTLLQNYEGPYILTDRRYKDSKAVYYRYGSIRPKNQDNLIYGPSGEVFEDNRSPYYQIPEWETDVFGESMNNNDNDNGLLNNRYSVIEAIRFTNAGGTYLAKDTLNDQLVIIKEARPYVAEYGFKTNAVTMKEKEYDILLHLHKTINNPRVPLAIDIFKEWEHTFLVESYIEGKTAKEYFMAINYFSRPGENIENLKFFLEKIFIFIKKLISALKIIHEQGIIISDISSENIIVDEELNPYFVDLDGALNHHSDEEKILIGTMGFYDSEDESISEIRDYQGIGYLALALLTPPYTLATLDKTFPRRHLKFLEMKYSMPKVFSEFILNLIDNGSADEISVERMKNIIQNMRANSSVLSLSELKLEKNIDGLCEFLKESTIEDQDILYPSHLQAENYIGIDGGTAGVLLSLLKLQRKDVDYKDIIKQLKNQCHRSREESLSLGLMNGLTGIAWVLIDYNDESEFAENLISKVNNEVKRNINSIGYTLDEGLTGIGLANLKFYLKTGKKKYLEVAEIISDFIINSNLKEDIKIGNVGLNKGYSGIALFLLYMYKIKGDGRLIDLGWHLINKDLNEFEEVNGGWLFPLKRNTNDRIFYPYLAEGTAGITAVFARYISEFPHENDKKEVFEKLLLGMDVEFSVDLGLFKGLSGIANVYMDSFFFLDNIKSKEKALNIIENILSTLVETDSGILKSPTTLMFRYGADYNSGGAGILELLERVKNMEMDYYIFLDNYLSEKLSF